MPDDDIEMRIPLLRGRFDRVCASALAKLLGEFVYRGRKAGSGRSPRKAEKIGTVVLVVSEIALGCGRADVLEVSLGTHTDALGSVHPEFAQK